MGVSNLWRLLLPIGRRISVETLEGQILAVDASIWLTQFLQAMRDQETGQATPAAHILGFFRRLCKLRFHGIRPVVVFDGATPEIKLRELAARRKRKNDFEAKGGEAAVARLAKKMLVEHLQKAAKVRVNDKKQVRIQPLNDNNNNGNGGYAPGFYPGRQSSRANEVAATTTSGEATAEIKSIETNCVGTTGAINMDEECAAAAASGTEFAIHEENGEIRVTSSGGDHHPVDLLPDETTTTNNDHLNENDWDKPIATNLEDDDSDQDGDEHDNESDDNQSTTEYDDVLERHHIHGRGRNKKVKRKLRNKKKPNGALLDIDHVASLPAAERKDAIEDAKRQQRLHSRREFMPVAAHAEQYSQVQLRNFLRSSKLNREIVQMAKSVAQQSGRGDVLASDPSRRIILERDEEADRGSRHDHRKRQRELNARLFGKGESDDESSGSSSSSNEEEDAENDTADGFLTTAGKPTKARQLLQGKRQPEQSKNDAPSPSPTRTRRLIRKQQHQSSASLDETDDSDGGGGEFLESGKKVAATTTMTPSKQRAIQEDSSDDDSDGGGGFLSSTQAKASAPSIKKHRVLSVQDSDDDDDDGGFVRDNKQQEALGVARKPVVTLEDSDDDEGGGFMTSDTAAAPKAAARNSNSMFGSETIMTAQSDDDSAPGGFLRGKPVPLAGLKSTGLNDQVIVIDEDDQPSQNQKSDAEVAQEIQDQMLAEELQKEEDYKLATSYNVSTTHEPEPLEDGGDEIVSSQVTTKAAALSSEKEESEHVMERSRQEPRILIPTILGADGSGGFVDDDEDEDVDWEDAEGDEQIEHNNAQAIPVTTHDSEYTEKPQKQDIPGHTSPTLASETNGDNEDDVVWEDGGDEEEEAVDSNEVSSAQHVPRREPQVAVAKANEPPSDDSDCDIEIEDDDDDDVKDAKMSDVELNDKQHNEDNGIADFGAAQKIDTTAALQQAEATASNLTNWAGRAVRRAIAEHLGEPSPQKSAQANDNEEATESLSESEEAEELFVSESATNVSNGKKATNANAALTINDDNAEAAEQIMHNYEADLATDQNNRVEREMDSVTDEMLFDIMKLLELFGIPYVRAPAEAEAQCAELEKLGLVNGIVTEDSDVFVFGGKTVYKNIFDDNKFVEVYRASDAKKDLALDRNEFVALAMMLGGDYTDGVKGVGIVNGMEIIQSFDFSPNVKDGLQKFRTWLDGFDPVVEANARKDRGAKKLTREQAFHQKHRTARTRWIAPNNFPSDAVISAYLHPVVDNSTARFTWGIPDEDGLVEFVNKHVGWRPEETRRQLGPVIEKVKGTYRQTRMDSYMRYEDGIKFADIRSKRLRDVLGGVQRSRQTEKGASEDVDANEVEHDTTSDDVVPSGTQGKRKSAREPEEEDITASIAIPEPSGPLKRPKVRRRRQT